MNNTAYNNLHTVKTSADLPAGAAYYSVEYFDTRSVHQTWYVFYDQDTTIIDRAKTAYTAALDGLQRIVRNNNTNTVYLAYDRKPLNDQYDLLLTNPNTTVALEAAAASVNPF